MNNTIHTLQYLVNIFTELKGLVLNGEIINFSYEIVTRLKTKKQLGYIFGGIIGCMIRHYQETGDLPQKINKGKTQEQIKDDIYEQIGEKELYYSLLTGKKQWRNITLSQMTVNECVDFIIKLIDLLEEKGIVLPPDLYYVWTKRITIEMLKAINVESWKRSQPEYKAYIKTKPCISCGRYHISQPHHLRITNNSGMALKDYDYMIIPLCNNCHNGLLHQKGERSFYEPIEKLLGLDIQNFCIVSFNRWLNKIN